MQFAILYEFVNKSNTCNMSVSYVRMNVVCVTNNIIYLQHINFGLLHPAPHEWRHYSLYKMLCARHDKSTENI